MKRMIISLVKKHTWLYNLYFVIFNNIIKCLGIFVKAKESRVLFVCNGGRRFADNIFPIFEEMVNDERFKNWRFTWAFRDPKKYDLSKYSRTDKVKVDTLSYYLLALSSKCWVTNVTIQRGLSFKRDGNYYVNTWHGFPIKFVGKDILKGPTFQMKEEERFDLMLTEGETDAITLNSAFDINSTIVTGYPRNDKMFVNREETCKKTREVLGIPQNKMVILYAPTYRDYDKDEHGNFAYDNNISFELFNDILGEDYVLLVRSHPAIELKYTFSNQCIDVSSYPCIEDLLVCSDILISDYSGVIADFALLEKPVFCYYYDFDKYRESRGLYQVVLDNMMFSSYKTEKGLFEAIKNIDYEAECKKSKYFVDKCGLLGQGATKRAVDAIAAGLQL